MKIIIRLLAFIGLILLYLLGIFVIIFKGSETLFVLFDDLAEKLD